jgi:uncharacterized protein with NAD-binding domain and iron-sulfur cluster
MPRVVVIGGGIGGLTVAHELGERGFDVHIYESRSAWGGKARTEPVVGSGVGGRRDLPGEHGFRFYPRFYRHVIDMMARTPIGDGSGATVDSRLRPCTEAGVALIGADHWSCVHRRAFARPYDVIEAVEVLFQQLRFDPADAGLFAMKILQYLASSDERRLGEYERLSWWEYLNCDGYSASCQNRANWIPRMLVAMDARTGNARTNGNTSMQLIMDFTTTGAANDRTMGGPTSEMWIEPWVALLSSIGVSFHPGETCTALDVAGGRVVGARFASGAIAEGDHFVLAVPIEAVQQLMSDDLAALDPQCARLRDADVDRLVSWMVGLQFYLHEDVPLARGHMVFPDAPWALTAISQPQFWRDTIGSFPEHYGDGTVAGLISVDISQWDTVGSFVQKTARQCTKEEIKTEVWSQLKAALRGGRGGEPRLTDDLLHSWHLDDDVEFGDGEPRNRSRLLIHPPGSWEIRPDAASAVPNLCFAADYVRTFTDIASMEGACEAGRRAANAILDREQSPASRVEVWPLDEPKEFLPWKRLDADLYRQGRPHVFEILGIRHAFQAADLLRRFSALTGLVRLEDLFREFKLTDLVGGLFDRFGLRR